MRNLLNIATLFFLLSAAPLSAAETAELPAEIAQAFETYVNFTDTLLPALQSVKNQETANAAAPQLRAALQQLYDIRNQLKGITELSDAQKAVVEQRYARRMREQWGKVYSEINRLQQARCFYSGEYAELFHALELMLNK